MCNKQAHKECTISQNEIIKEKIIIKNTRTDIEAALKITHFCCFKLQLSKGTHVQYPYRILLHYYIVPWTLLIHPL